MMKVRTLKPHINGYGEPGKTNKTAGTEYEMPDVEAQMLIDDGIVEKVTKEEAAKAADSDGGTKKK